MPGDGTADRSVRIVTDEGEADESVFVVNGLVVPLDGADPGDVLTVQSDGTVAPDAPTGGGDPNALPAATAFTTTTMPNPVGGGNMTVIVLPEDDAVLAIAIAGDAFPRWLLTGQTNDGLYMGDGTVNPYSNGANIYAAPVGAGEVALVLVDSAGHSIVLGPAAVSVQPGTSNNGDLAVIGKGITLLSPNESQHRIKVANDGTLSTELVT